MGANLDAIWLDEYINFRRLMTPQQPVPITNGHLKEFISTHEYNARINPKDAEIHLKLAKAARDELEKRLTPKVIPKTLYFFGHEGINTITTPEKEDTMQTSCGNLTYTYSSAPSPLKSIEIPGQYITLTKSLGRVVISTPSRGPSPIYVHQDSLDDFIKALRDINERGVSN